MIRFLLPNSLKLLGLPSNIWCLFYAGIVCLTPSTGTAADLIGQLENPINMVWVDLGKNDSNKKNKHSFWIDRFEVTQKEYSAVMGTKIY